MILATFPTDFMPTTTVGLFRYVLPVPLSCKCFFEGRVTARKPLPHGIDSVGRKTIAPQIFAQKRREARAYPYLHEGDALTTHAGEHKLAV
jgi:hypothetical protein